MIIAMAHHLKIKVVAEGIETKDELIFLQQNAPVIMVKDTCLVDHYHQKN